jgi:poly(beta-D-mannuronate) lyase
MKLHTFVPFLFFAALGFQTAAFAVSPPVPIMVDSLEALQTRIDNATPWQTIILRDGTYILDQPLIITSVGTKELPITIRAQTVGGVELTGPQGFDIRRGAAHIVLDGFKFTNAAGRNNIRVGASHIRITRCVFICPGRGAYLVVSGDDIQIDHNEFRDKSRWGNMISITGENGIVAKRVWIHRNFFYNFSRSTEPGETNDLEVIRYGLSHLSMSNGYGIIEHNLFVRCVGENELISNKSGRNTYRYNTFLDSRGSELSLRHGNEVRAYRNYFRNTAGIRIFGDRHEIFENFLENNSIGVHIGNGGAKIAETNAPLTSHDRPDDAVIRNNILLNNNRQFIMARRNNGLGAHRTTIAENTIVGGNVVAQIEGPFPGAVWRDNIVWNNDNLGDMPESGMRRVDPGSLSPETFGIRVLTPADVGPFAPTAK